MINRVIAKKAKRNYNCKPKENAPAGGYLWKCGHCGDGVVITYPGENRMYYYADRKYCDFCHATFIVEEISR